MYLDFIIFNKYLIFYFYRLILLMKLVGATPLKDDKTRYILKIPLATLPSFNKQPKRK